MDYIKQLNAFGDDMIYNAANNLSDKAFRLYYSLLHCINKLHWKENVQIANNTLMQLINTTNDDVLSRARKELVEKGYIKYSKGRKGIAGKYNLVKLYDKGYSEGYSEGNSEGNSEGYDEGNCKGYSRGYSKDINKTKTKTKTETNNIPPISPTDKQRKPDDILSEIEDDTLREALEEFIKMRKQIKKPLTPHALELSIKKLYGMSADTAELTKIVEQSVMNSWQSFYPLKDRGGNNQSCNSGDEYGTNNIFLQIAQERGIS